METTANHRWITLTCVSYNLLTRVLAKRLRYQIDETLEQSQHGCFRAGRSTQDHVLLTVKQIGNKNNQERESTMRLRH